MDEVVSAGPEQGNVRRFRATPETAQILRQHVAATGGSAMMDAKVASRFRLAGGGGFIDGYVPAGVADEMASAFYMEKDPQGNVTLREVEFEEALGPDVPIAAIALYLEESLAAREHNAGRRVLEELLARV